MDRGTNHILAIGINDYIYDRPDNLKDLANCVNDVNEIINALSEKYDYFLPKNIHPLLNEEATAKNIKRALLDYIEGKAGNFRKNEDNFILLYSGHGSRLFNSTVGYLIPADAQDQTDYLSLYEIKALLDLIEAKHILVIFDSCFSGLIFNFRDTAETVKNLPEDIPSRYALTSGRDQPVLDGMPGAKHSPFAQALLDVLRDNFNGPKDKLGAITLSQSILKNFEAKGYSDDQLPDSGYITAGLEHRGQFYFYPKGWENNALARQAKKIDELQNALRLAKAQTLAAKAMLLKTTDLAIALRLAEAAYRYYPNEETAAVFRDLIKDPDLTFCNQKLILDANADILDLAFSLDKKFVLGACGDHTAKIWTIEGKFGGDFKGHSDQINAVAFSPDGFYVLTGSKDNTAKLWDLEGELIMTFKTQIDSAFAPGISADGTYGVLKKDDFSSGGVTLPLRGEVFRPYSGHTGSINSVAFSPQDGKLVLTGSSDTTAKLWNWEGMVMMTFAGHKGAVNAVAFSPDGNHVLTGSEDKTAILWDLEGKVVKIFSGHIGSICSLAFSTDADGKYILTGSKDKTARLWDLQGSGQAFFVGHSGDVISVVFSQDNKNILTGSRDKTARLWDLQGNLIWSFTGHAGAIRALAFSEDGKDVLTGSDDKALRLWGLKGQVVQTFNTYKQSVTFSPDGKFVLTGSDGNTATLWDLKGEAIQIFKKHTQRVNSVAFSPDGKFVLTGSEDNTATLWDLKGEAIQTFKEDREDINLSELLRSDPTLLTYSPKLKGINSVAFSPDGKFVLTGSQDDTATLWDLKGEAIQSFAEHWKPVCSVAFSPDGKFVLTGSKDNTAKLWNLQGGVIQTFDENYQYGSSVAFSPDGMSVLTGGYEYDYKAKLWDLKGRVLQSFTGHNKQVTSVAFSPDGKFVLTGSADTTAKLWDLNGNLLQTFWGHRDEINSVAFSSDGRYVLSGSLDATAILWKTIFTSLEDGSIAALTPEQKAGFGIGRESN